MTRPRPGPGSRFPRPPGRPPTPRPGCFWGSSKVPDKIMILDENMARRGAGFKIPTPGPGLTHTSCRATFAPKILSGAWGRPRIFCGRGGVHPEGPDFCQFRNWLLGCTQAGIAGTESGSEHAPQTNRKCTPGSGRGRAFAKRDTHQLNAIAFSTLKKFARPTRPIVADPGTSKQVKDVWY